MDKSPKCLICKNAKFFASILLCTVILHTNNFLNVACHADAISNITGINCVFIGATLIARHHLFLWIYASVSFLLSRVINVTLTVQNIALVHVIG